MQTPQIAQTLEVIILGASKKSLSASLALKKRHAVHLVFSEGSLLPHYQTFAWVNQLPVVQNVKVAAILKEGNDIIVRIKHAANEVDYRTKQLIEASEETPESTLPLADQAMARVV